MHLSILSDLHLEFAPFQAQALGEVVILAGDIHTGKNGLRWARTAFPQTPVLYVLGNHEFYGQTMQKLLLELKQQAAGTNIHILDNDRFEMGGVMFLGATLWTDFELFGTRSLSEITAANGMTDFRRIRTLPHYRRLRPAEAHRLHLQSLAWLHEQLQDTVNHKVVVITHHAPSPQSIGAPFADDPLNPAYASNLEPFIREHSIALWVHGHIHYHSDYRIGDTRIVANPRGYPDDVHSGFIPDLLIDI